MTRPVGTVERVGDQLRIRLPEPATDEHWQRLLDHLAGLIVDVQPSDRCAHVELDRGAGLAARLDAWPATTIEWHWDHHAEQAVAERAALAEALNKVLAVTADDQADWPAGLDLPGAGFVRELRPFQRRSVARLLTIGNGADFSVPGAGKTTVAYAIFAALRSAGRIDAALVLAPLSAFETWELEAHDCFAPGHRPRLALRPDVPARDADVLVVNYEQLQRRRALAELDAWIANRRVLVVFDEAHRAKAGQRGVRGRGAVTVARRTDRRLVLTGTPMPNGVADLAAVFDLAWPGHGPRLAAGDLAGLRDRAYVRVTKDQLDLPELDLRVELVELEPAHRAVYDALAGQAAALAADPAVHDAAELGRALLRLVAAATNPAAILEPGEPFSLPPGPSTGTLADMLAAPTAHVRPAKIVRAAQLVAANAVRGRKTLVWSNFVANVAALRDALAAHHPAVIVGATPVDDPGAVADRRRELDRFRHDPDCRVLVATPQTLGEGISLHQVCVDQIHVDRGFAAGTFLQSLDRTHRLGMAPDAAPTCTVLLAAHTIDEHVQKILATKVATMTAALSDPNLVPLGFPDHGSELDLTSLLLADLQADEFRRLLAPVISRTVRNERH